MKDNTIRDLMKKNSILEAEIACLNSKLNSKGVLEALGTQFKIDDRKYITKHREFIWTEKFLNEPELLKMFEKCNMSQRYIVQNIIQIYNKSSINIYIIQLSNYLIIHFICKFLYSFPDNLVCILQCLLSWQYPDVVYVTKRSRLLLWSFFDEDDEEGENAVDPD